MHEPRAVPDRALKRVTFTRHHTLESSLAFGPARKRGTSVAAQDGMDESKRMRALVTWGSKLGETEDIARIMGEALERAGFDVVLKRAPEVRDASAYDAAIIGGALYANRWHHDAGRQLASCARGPKSHLGRACARRGFFNGSRPPFGFQIEKRPGPGGDSKNHLVVDGREAEIIRELFRLYVGGRGAKATAADLNQRGLLYRGTLWHRDLVLKVVSDEAAVG